MTRVNHLNMPQTVIGRGQGKGGTRHSDPAKKSKKTLTRGAIRRLARRGGVHRISKLSFELAVDVFKSFLAAIIRDSWIFMQHSKRKTVAAEDVIRALKRRGHTLYGFDRL